jgi:hypothetical protein
MSAFVTAGGGFLLAVLWFDLMFDVQVLGRDSSQELPEAVLASIAGYYARVTTAARPMSRLIPVVMIGVLSAIVVEVVRGFGPEWVPWASVALALAPILLVGVRTVPSAVRLGSRVDAPGVQSRMARSVLREHLFCFASIVGLIALQLAAG